ncbi:hypothetical protein H920_13319 [Fukomys damarensis]|uniref:Uncharacterized protein n=1 Tax=Fukomys damarensis TaxID=885580 RepID=A0A091DR74_FUKDA|nr:hypothetical protein H920_13319 [Fukomys damarensis]
MRKRVYTDHTDIKKNCSMKNIVMDDDDDGDDEDGGGNYQKIESDMYTIVQFLEQKDGSRKAEKQGMEVVFTWLLIGVA